MTPEEEIEALTRWLQLGIQMGWINTQQALSVLVSARGSSILRREPVDLPTPSGPAGPLDIDHIMAEIGKKK